MIKYVHNDTITAISNVFTKAREFAELTRLHAVESKNWCIDVAWFDTWRADYSIPIGRMILVFVVASPDGFATCFTKTVLGPLIVPESSKREYVASLFGRGYDLIFDNGVPNWNSYVKQVKANMIQRCNHYWTPLERLAACSDD